MRYVWALVFWVSIILFFGAAYVAWDLSEGNAVHRDAAVLVAAFIAAVFATSGVFSFRLLVRSGSKGAE